MKTCSGDLSMVWRPFHGDGHGIVTDVLALHALGPKRTEGLGLRSGQRNRGFGESLPSHFEEASGTQPRRCCRLLYHDLRLRGLVIFQAGRELRARGEENGDR